MRIPQFLLVKVVDILLEGRKGTVLFKDDESSGLIGLWTFLDPFRDGRTLYALRHYFPCLEIIGPVLRLGNFQSIIRAEDAIKSAREKSISLAIRTLYRRPN